ncbi:MAG: hypothetical protein N2652_08635 [Kiritimatiellae bacterium]|nr:hypothetical protein [Kiritimatiellia bacterium]
MTDLSDDALRPRGLWAALAGVMAMAAFFSVYSPYAPAASTWSPPWPATPEAARQSPWAGWSAPGVLLLEDSQRACVRLVAGHGPTPSVAWTTAALPTQRTVMVRVVWRGEGVVHGEQRYQTARVTLCVTDAEGRWRYDVPHVAASLYGTREWHEAGRPLVLPDWATTARLAVTHGGVSGIVEVADLSAVPLCRRAEAPWITGAWWTVWLSGALIAIWRLRLLQRRGGRAVLLVGALILLAVTMPESWFHPVELWIGGQPTPADRITGDAAVRNAAVTPSDPRPPPATLRRPVAPSRWRAMIANMDLHAAAHLALFAVLALVTARCFGIRLVASGTQWHRSLPVVAGLLIYGLAAELIQCLTITRGPGIRGAMMNWLGTGLGLLIAEAAQWGTSRFPPADSPVGPSLRPPRL